MKLAGNSIQEVAENIANLRRWKPYEYGGKFFVIQLAGQFEGFRSKQAAQNKATKSNAGEIPLYILE